MKNFFENKIIKSKIRIAVTIIIGVALLWLIIVGAKQQEFSQGQTLLLIGVWLLIEIIQLFSIEINVIFSWPIYLITPYIAFLLLERFVHYPFDLEMSLLIINTIIFFMVFLFLLFLTGNSKIGGIIGLLVPMIFGIANYFVLQFRSTPIVPWDIYSTRTALSVAAGYKFEFSYYMVLSVTFFTLLIVIMSKTSLRFKKPRVRVGMSIVSLVLFLIVVNRTWDEDVKEEFGLFEELFSPSKMQRVNGTAANFLMIIQYMSVGKPDNYSVLAVNDIIEILLADSAEAASTEIADGVRPNIIVIMNEALSDLSVIGDLETNKEYFPFINSLQKNTIKGNVYVSVKGGNTANSEFEFLTGNTMAFLPSGSIPYQQFIHGETPSLAWQLKELGYNATAIHPYGSRGWNRYQVYPYLGFDASYFQDSFIEPEYIRSYVSDREAYNRIIDLYENKKEGEKEFIFTVTMQNHGGYTNEYENFISDVFATNVESKSLNQYLSLMKQSDIAFEELITYFSEQEEETIILMFGDHQPTDSVVKPINEANGISSNNQTIEQREDRYITPYIMWANYDIEEAEGEDTSANYLLLLLLEQAGIPLTKYQQALLEISKIIPVITANAYMDSEGIFYNTGDKAYEEILDMYAILQYNGLIDTRNRLDNIFSLGE